jgi:hypothetical protein
MKLRRLYIKLYWNMLMRKFGWKKGENKDDFIY